MPDDWSRGSFYCSVGRSVVVRFGDGTLVSGIGSESLRQLNIVAEGTDIVRGGRVLVWVTCIDAPSFDNRTFNFFSDGQCVERERNVFAWYRMRLVKPGEEFVFTALDGATRRKATVNADRSVTYIDVA